MTFFGQLALPTWLIALLVGSAMLVVIILTIHLQFMATTPPNKIWSMILISLYWIIFTTMTAGITQIAGSFISVITLILSGVIVLFGLDKLQRLNNIIVLTIIIMLVVICLPHQTATPTTTFYTQIPAGLGWAFLYAGLNCLTFSELVKAAAQHCSRRTLYGAGVITASLITALVFLILTAIRQTGTQNAAMPLLAIANHPLTMVLIILAILTSQYAALFAMVQKTTNLTKRSIFNPQTWVILYGATAFAGSFFGFSQILNIGYRIIGAVICFSLLFSWLRSWRHHPQH